MNELCGVHSMVGGPLAPAKAVIALAQGGGPARGVRGVIGWPTAGALCTPVFQPVAVTAFLHGIFHTTWALWVL